MEIANVVTKDKINIGPEFNVVENLEDIIYRDLPTLIIGYDFASELYGKDILNPLNRAIDKNLFWTFDKKVKRVLFDSDIEDFIKYSYKNRIKHLSFVNVDFIQFNQIKLFKIVKKILVLNNPIAYHSDSNVVYIYGENIIFIIDLNLLKYLKSDVNNILKKIKEKSHVFLSGEEILIEYNNHLGRLDSDIKLLPFLYSINPHD
tara:strand:+ start:9564 stop:10175 length:612 start_codon:yes stop_codon:yes gene_type:complete